MTGVADSAVGAILEIPPQALGKIKEAENAIKKLQAVSAEAAGNVNLHWGEVATNGLQKFIDKIADAKARMEGLGTINVTLNTQAAVQSTEQLSTATQKTSADVSKAVQDMATVWNEQLMGMKAPFGFDAIDTSSVKSIRTELEKIKAAWIDSGESGERRSFIVNGIELTRQQLADLMNYLEKGIEQWRTFSGAKADALAKMQTQFDTSAVKEYTKLLQDQIKYQKQLDELRSKIDVRKAKGGGPATLDELKQMEDLKTKLNSINTSLDAVKGKYEQLSVAGKEAWNTSYLDSIRAKQEAQIRLTDKEAEALERIKKAQDRKDTTAQNKSDKAYLDEQKRLLADILDLRKQVNGQKIVVAQGQVTGSSTLEQDKKILSDLIARLYEAKDKLKEYNAEKYKNVSAEGQAKAQVNALNQENALIKEQMAFREKLNSAIARGNELVAQTQAGKARLGSSDESVAQRQLNSDYKEMLKIIKEQGELKAKVASEGRQMNQDEINLIATLAQRYRTYYDDIKRIEGAYANMAQASAQAFQNDKTAQLARNATLLADAQNKAAEAAQKVADAQAKAAQQQADKNRSQSESDLNRLYTERLRLLKEKEQLENKALINTAKGLPDLTAKENQLLAEVTAKLQSVDNQIKAIGNSYRGLQLKAQHAFELPELRQAVQLQNQLNKELDSVDTNNAKQLTAEYKRLTAEAQKLAQIMREYTQAGGDKNSTAYQQLQSQFANIMMQRRLIETENIDSVNAYRQQRQTAAYQQDLSAFIQAESQKTAEAKKQAEQQSNDRIQAYQKFLNTYQGAMAAANRLGTRGGWEDTYENRARVIKNLESAIKNLNKADSDYEKKLNNLTTALNNLKNKQQEVNNAMTSQPKPNVADAQWLANVARGTKTLEDYKRAYDVLIEVMSRTPKNSTDFKNMSKDAQDMKRNIEEVEKAMAKFRNQSQQTSNIMGQLQGRIAAAFSVGAITGFIRKMVDVRAQFELQRVALGAIIQDRDEANKIFTQVQNMALESPFNIMQLEKATKQIAAFGFETQKLVPTMKMFADISAGLGVEIDRLVLVMGHLKARNFLEGTMVRQFTNMGFNVLGELSKYYTELEGKMVSVGEVQDRVKKKMVSFEDVEEVLKRVTSAGGMFYDMQKKQSDSLWGQMQRIQDAYDLMLNEIGQSNEGILKSVLTAIRSLINSWRSLKPYIVSVIAAMGAFGASMLILRGIPMLVTNITRGFNMLGASLGIATKQQLALNFAQKANVWGALLSIIVAVGVAIYEVATAQDKLTESLDRVRGEGIGNMYDLIYQYQKLADTVRDSTTPYEERKKALEELHRIYGEILPTEMLEISHIKMMKDGYEEATEAIKAYSAEKTKENLKSEIENIVGKDIQDEGDDLATSFAQFLEDWKMLPDKMPKDTFRTIAKTMITEISEEVKSGTIPVEKAIDELKKRMKERLRGIIKDTDIDKMFERFDMGTLFGGNLSDWTEQLQKFQDQVKGIDIGIEGVLQTDAVMKQRKEFDNLRESVSAYNLALENIKDIDFAALGGLKQDEQGHILNVTPNIMDMDAINAFNAALDEVNAKGKVLDDTFTFTANNISQALQSDADMSVAVSDNIQKTLIATLDMLIATAKDPAVKKFFENLRNEIAQTKLTPIQKDVEHTMELIAKKSGVQKSIFDKLKLAGINSYADVRKKAKELSDEAAENIKRIAATRIELMLLGLTAAEAQRKAEEMWGNGQSEEELKKEQKAWEELWKAHGGYEKSKNKSKSSGTDKELKRLQDLGKAIKDVTTKYEELRKSYDVTTSNKMIEDMYSKVFKELGSDIKLFYKDGKYDAEELIKALRILQGEVKATTDERKKYRSELERDIDEQQVKIKLELAKEEEEKLKKQLDDMFASYELSKELKKLGLNVDLVFMLGGEPLDLNDLRAKITKMYQDAGGDKASENEAKEYRDRLKKIEELELKERKERVKEYHKYFVKTVGERAQIELEYLKKMDDVRQMYEFTDAQRQDALRQLTEEKNKKLADQVWKDFKGGEIYQMMFKDLDNISEKALVTMRTELERIRDSFKSLSPHDLKEINKAINDINKQIVDRNPFKSLVDSFKDLSKYAKERKNLEKDFQDAVKRSGELMDEIAEKESKLSQLREKSSLYKIDQIDSEINNLKKQIAELEKEGVTSEEQAKIDALNEQIKLLEEKKKKLQEIAALNQSEEDSMHSEIKGLESEVAGLNVELGESNNKAEESGKKLSAGAQKANDISTAFSKIRQQAEGMLSEINGIIDGLDRMGVLSDAFKDTWESVNDIFSGVMDFAEGGAQAVAGFMSGDIVGGITGTLKSIKGAVNAVASIFEIGDKSKERQIKSLKESVEALDKAYQKLEKSIESAYNFAQYNAEFDKAKQNLDEQKKAYQEMMALEEAKKKTDKDKIKEYQDKLDDIAEKEEELRKSRHEMYGSTEDVWSEANNWVDAWLDAFKETGDGLDALNESWDEFYENLVKKQAASKVLGARMDSWVKQINDAIDKNMGSEYDYIDLFKQIGEKMKAEFDATNEDLKKIFEYAGIGGGAGELILSDLQKGIQNITEPQAAAIEAYLNSMRFAVFTHTEQLERLIATVQAQYGSGAENPVVTELKGIRSVLDSINSKFDSVIGKNGTQKGIRIAN